MPASNPVDILLTHDHWATRQVLTSCENLSPDQFQQAFEMGPGSLHDTVTHIIGAMRGWTDFLSGHEFRPRPEGERRSVAELFTMLDEAAQDLAAVVRAHPLDEAVTRERSGKSYTFTRGAVLSHVATHGMHHRAQCLNMLRHLGVTPLPRSSVMEWTMAGEPGR